MFRVDVYAQQGRPQDKPVLEPAAYASLVTAMEDSGGRLFTVGRKNATILLGSDKSVSRDHTHIHLLSENKQHQGVAGVPSSPEEKEACSLGPLGMAVLVKNLGKYGSVVVAMAPNNQTEEEEKESPKPSSGNDSDTDAGSDTEDENQKKDTKPNNGFSLPTIPGFDWRDEVKNISDKLLRDKSHKIVSCEKLEANQSKIIPGNATTILLNVGQHGSLIVLTRMDLLVAKSGFKQKKDEALFKEIYKVGGQRLEKNVEDSLLEAVAERNQDKNSLPPTIYMCCPEKDLVPKQLVAWNLGVVPFVTLEFFQKLLGRNAIQDPWPKTENFDPPSSNAVEGFDDNFWKTKPSTKLWRSCTFLSTNAKQHSVAAIVESAGGSLVDLEHMAEKEAKQTVSSLLEDPDTKDGLFTMNGGKKKLMKWILEQGVPQIDQKNIVRALCNQQPLKDQNERVLGKVEELGGEEKTPERDTEIRKTAHESPDSDATDIEEEITPAGRGIEDDHSKHSPNPSDAVNASKDEDVQNDNKENSQNQSKRARKNTAQGKINSQRQSQSQRNVEIMPSVQEEESMNLDESALLEVADEPTATSKKRRIEEEGRNVKGDKTKESRSRRLVMPGTARLQATSDGWLVAAPKNEEREAYLRPKNEILEHVDSDGEGGPLLPVAETVICSGLIHRSYDANRSESNTRVGKKSQTGVDYKRFKKNKVIAAGRSQIVLKKAELETETENLLSLEEQQKAIDEQERLADELFADHGKKQSNIAGARKRRKT